MQQVQGLGWMEPTNGKSVGKPRLMKSPIVGPAQPTNGESFGLGAGPKSISIHSGHFYGEATPLHAAPNFSIGLWSIL